MKKSTTKQMELCIGKDSFSRLSRNARLVLRFLLQGPRWAWLQSQKWAWLGGLTSIGLTMQGVGEFVLAAILYFLAAISCISQLWQWNPNDVSRKLKLFWHLLGSFVIVIISLCLLVIDWDAGYHGGGSWSRLPQAIADARSLLSPPLPEVPIRKFQIHEPPAAMLNPDSGKRPSARLNPFVPPPQPPLRVTPDNSAIRLSLSIVNPQDPGIVVINRTDRVAEGINWELLLYRESDLAPFSFATQPIGYVKPHSRSAVYMMSLPNLVKAENGGRDLHRGDVLGGTLILDCPLCTGESYVIHLIWGTSGWYLKHDDRASLDVPKSPINDDSVRAYLNAANAVRDEKRIPISPH